MIHGLDSSFLVAVEVAEHAQHSAARQILSRLHAAGDRIAIAPQVLAEFIHVVTDPRRFTRPLSTQEACETAQQWWTAREVEREIAFLHAPVAPVYADKMPCPVRPIVFASDPVGKVVLLSHVTFSSDSNTRLIESRLRRDVPRGRWGTLPWAPRKLRDPPSNASRPRANAHNSDRSLPQFWPPAAAHVKPPPPGHFPQRGLRAVPGAAIRLWLCLFLSPRSHNRPAKRQS